MSELTNKSQSPKSQPPKTAHKQSEAATAKLKASITPPTVPTPELTQFGMEVAAMPTLTLVPAQPALEKTTIEKLLQKMKDL